MSDKLKKYIADNRAHFDDEIPSAKVWDAISREVPKAQKKGNIIRLNKRFLWAAAAIFLVALTTIGYQGLTIRSLKLDSPAIVANTDIEPAEEAGWQMPDELKDLDQIYVQQVSSTMSLLKKYPEESEELRAELTALDGEFETLRQELGREYSSEQVLEAMIENYRYKLELLESTLEHFKRTDQIIEDENTVL